LSKAHETHDSLSSSYSQVVLIYLYPFRCNLLLKSTLQPQIVKKNTKTSIVKVQGHSRSSMFTPIKSLSPLLFVMISSIFLPICNRFHATRAN